MMSDNPDCNRPNPPEHHNCFQQEDDTPGDLRSQAEQALAGQTIELEGFSPDDIEQLIHELQVQKMEMELQNRELRQVRAELDQAREKYIELYDTTPVGYFSINAEGVIVEANQTASTLLGLHRAALLQSPFTHYILSDDQDIYYFHLKHLERSRTPQRCHLRLQKPDGTSFYARLESTFSDASAAGAPSYRVVAIDMTEQVQAERTLRDTSEELERRVAERTAELESMNRILHDEIIERKRAEEAVQRSERFKQAILDSLSAHIAVLDEASNIIMVNQAWRTFGESSLKNGSPVPERFNYLHVCDQATGDCVEGAAEFATGIRSVLAGEQEHFELEYPCHAPHRQYWFVGHVTRFEDEGHVYIVVAHEDITQRTLAEYALRHSEQRYRTLINHIPDGVVFLFDHDLRYLVAGGTVLEQLGLSEATIVGKTLAEITTPERFARLEPMYRAALAGESISAELTFKEHIYAFSAVPVKDEAGEIFAGIALIRDITAQKRMEQALQESEEKFRCFFEQSGDALALADSQGTLIEWNQGAKNIFGVSSEEVLGRPRWDVIYQFVPEEMKSPDLYARIKQSTLDFIACKDTFKPLQLEGHPIQCPDGARRAVHSTVFPIHTGRGMLIGSIIRDITELKQKEDALHSSVQFLETLLDTIPSPVFYKDTEGRYLGCNTLFARHIIGKPKEQIIGHTLHELTDAVPPDLAALYHEQDMHLLRNLDIQVYEAQAQCADRTRRDFFFSKATFKDATGGVAGIVGVMLDITERKKTEDALRASEARMRAVVNDAPVFLFALDHTGVFTLVEGRGLVPLSLRLGEIFGHSIFSLFQDVPALLERVHHALQGEQVRWEGQIRELYFEMTLIPHFAPNGSVHEVIGVALDLTERKMYQSRIERLAFTDPLTGLANRRRMYDMAGSLLSISHETDQSVALLFLDLNRFKLVNDTLGHDVGDEMLVQVAARLRACVRTGDMLARMGGDEFALLLPHSALDHALEMARRILHRLDQPFDLHDQLIDLGASIGIAVGNMAHSSFKMLLIQADVAMYRAKETGEYIHVYDPSLDSLAGSRLQLSEHMTRKKHILIVEDDRAVADMLVMLLETEGYRVTWLDNAASMVDLLTSYEFVSHKPAPHLYRADAAYQYAYPDVILLDLLLPNMDSIEVLQDIACKVPVMPPVIVVSARSQRDIQAAASVIGAVRMVRKPFEINMLLDIIKQVLMENHAG